MNDQPITDVKEIPNVPVSDPVQDEKIRAERQHFVDETFLRALPIALTVQNWTRKSEQGQAAVISSQKDRIALAWEIAQEAYANRPTVKL